METQVVTGPLTAIGTTTKAFVLAHPVGIAVVGGALLGYGGYKWLKKKDAIEDVHENEDIKSQETEAVPA